LQPENDLKQYHPLRKVILIIHFIDGN